MSATLVVTRLLSTVDMNPEQEGHTIDRSEPAPVLFAARRGGLEGLPAGTIVVTVERNGALVFADADTTLEPGDLVVRLLGRRDRRAAPQNGRWRQFGLRRMNSGVETKGVDRKEGRPWRPCETRRIVLSCLP